MRVLTLVLGSAVLLSLSACIYTDRSDSYRKSGSIKDLEVPEDLSSDTIESLYPIPEVKKRYDAFYDVEEDGFEIPRPEAMSAEREAQKVKIQKVAGRQWVLLEAPASQVWPLAQSFLINAGLGVQTSVPSTGLIETDWVSFKNKEDSQAMRFRIRIEKGLRPDTTEVHFLHQGAEPDKARSIDSWPQTSDDPERADWIMMEMANSLALDIGNKAASLLGQSVGGQAKAELTVENGEPVLALNLDQDRAWATVQQAVQKGSLLTWEVGANDRVIYAQYLDPKARSTWHLERSVSTKQLSMESKKSRYQIEEAPYTLNEVLANLSDIPASRALFADVAEAKFGQSGLEPVGILIRLQQSGGRILVKVRDMNGELLDSRINKKVLIEIRKHLI